MTTQKYPSLSDQTICKLSIKFFLDTTTDDRQSGLTWYHDAKAFAQEVMEEYGGGMVTLPQVVGALSALSPRTSWETNKLLLIDLIVNGSCGTTLRRQDKAMSILLGDYGDTFDSVINAFDPVLAPKTRAFYRAILGDERAVTVDAHMTKLYYGELVPLKNCNRGSNIARGMTMAAAALNVQPRELQAILWVYRIRVTGKDVIE